MKAPHQEKVENNVHLGDSVADPLSVVMSKGRVLDAASSLARNGTTDSTKFCPQEKSEAVLERKDQLKRPMEVPHQTKVENAIHLTGSVAEPLKLVKSNDGVLNAVSILARSTTAGSPNFWIPIVFQGRLAETAVCHVKENDVIYVTGELCGGQSAASDTQGTLMYRFQVIVQNFNFVKDQGPGMKHHNVNVAKDPEPDKKLQEEDDTKSPELSRKSLWNAFVDHPEAWIDYRKKKQEGLVKPRYPDFKHKDTDQSLWMEDFPEWMRRKIKDFSFAVPNDNLGRRFSLDSKKTPSVELWKNLVESPDRWVDNRKTKTKPTQPDFMHKETGEALWLGTTTPSWVHTKITSLPTTRAT